MSLSYSILRSSQNNLAQVTLDSFNQSYGAENDSSRYEQLKTDVRFPLKIIDLLNHLQIAELIPDRIAILVKNNLHDTSFVKATLGNLILDLKDKNIISENCAQKLHLNIQNGRFEIALTYLYTILIYSKIAELHAQNQPNPVFRFLSPENYSNRIIQLNEFQLDNEMKKLETEFQKKALGQLLLKLGAHDNSNQTLAAQRIQLFGTYLQKSPEEFKQALINYVQSVIDQTPHLEKIYFKELLELIEKTPADKLNYKLYCQLATEEHLKRCVRSIKALNQSLSTMPHDRLRTEISKCKKAYNGTVYLLRDCKNLPSISSIRYHQIVGNMKSEWEKTNAIASSAIGHYTHMFCSCQATLSPTQNDLAEWPFHSNALTQFENSDIRSFNTTRPPDSVVLPVAYQANQKKSIAVIGCDWGGGHREATRGIAKHLAKTGYHVNTVDLPKVLESEDPVRNCFLTRWLNQDWTVGSVFNGLLKEKAYAFLNFLKSMGSGAPDPEQYQRKLLMTINQLLTSNPDMVITTYSADNELIFDACELLGIPCLHYSTDIDTSVETRTAPRESRHMKMAIAFDEPDMIQRIQTTTRPDQRVIGGPLVRPEFNIPRTAQDAIRFKQEKGIDANKKVVVISNGKNGTFSKYPELLAKKYANTNPQDVPIHLVILCGANNAKFMKHLQKNVQPYTNMPMSILSFVPGEDMEKYMTMAAHGGCLVGKAGGGTLFEAATRGTRLLIDNIRPHFLSQGLIHFFTTLLEWFLQFIGYEDQLPWEKINTDFAKKYHFADSFDSEDEFMTKLDQVLENNTPVQMPFHVQNCQQVLTQTVGSMMQAAETDLELHRIRQQLKTV